MINQTKKHYMSILSIIVFVSVFLYQFFHLFQIPFITQYSLQEINYLNLILYILLVLLVVILSYNIFLLLTIEISQTFILPSIRVKETYQNFSSLYISKSIVTNKYKTYSVFRCWFIVFDYNKNLKNYERKIKWKNEQKSYFCVL